MNRWLANPVARPIARRLPLLALVHHVGRTSGRRYATPIMAFRSGERRTKADMADVRDALFRTPNTTG